MQPNVVRYYNSWVECVPFDKYNDIDNIHSKTRKNIAPRRRSESACQTDADFLFDNLESSFSVNLNSPPSAGEQHQDGIFFFEDHVNDPIVFHKSSSMSPKVSKLTPSKTLRKLKNQFKGMCISDQLPVKPSLSLPSKTAKSPKAMLSEKPADLKSPTASKPAEISRLLNSPFVQTNNPDPFAKTPVSNTLPRRTSLLALKSLANDQSKTSKISNLATALLESPNPFTNLLSSPWHSDNETSSTNTDKPTTTTSSQIRGAMWATTSDKSEETTDSDDMGNNVDIDTSRGSSENEDLLFDPFAEPSMSLKSMRSIRSLKSVGPRTTRRMSILDVSDSDDSYIKFEVASSEEVSVAVPSCVTVESQPKTQIGLGSKTKSIAEAERDADMIGIWVGVVENAGVLDVTDQTSDSNSFSEQMQPTQFVPRIQRLTNSLKLSSSCPQLKPVTIPQSNMSKSLISTHKRRASADTEIAPPPLPMPTPPEEKVTLYIVMQLCSRTTLQKWLQTRNDDAVPKIDRQTNINIFRQIVQGLAHVHASGFIHRDIKPANIFVEQDGRVLIGDFGLAKDVCATENFPVAAFSRRGNGLTSGVGTLLYSSPEQLGRRGRARMGGRKVGRRARKALKESGVREFEMVQEVEGEYYARTDVYSLGVVFFELFWPFKTASERIAT
ncbi:hypothetical protein HK096_011239, partial [Nowakowskiella sp. JEL0078]